MLSTAARSVCSLSALGGHDAGVMAAGSPLGGRRNEEFDGDAETLAQLVPPARVKLRLGSAMIPRADLLPWKQAPQPRPQQRGRCVRGRCSRASWRPQRATAAPRCAAAHWDLCDSITTPLSLGVVIGNHEISAVGGGGGGGGAAVGSASEHGAQWQRGPSGAGWHSRRCMSPPARCHIWLWLPWLRDGGPPGDT